MTSQHRGKALSSLFALFFGAQASAAGIVVPVGVPGYVYSFDSINSPPPQISSPPYFPDALSACNAVSQTARLDRIGVGNPSGAAASGYTVTWTGTGPETGGSAQCIGDYYYVSGTINGVVANIYRAYGVVSTGGCPLHSTPDGATCKCDADYGLNGSAATQCVPLAVPDGPAKKPAACWADPGLGKPIFPVTGTKRYRVDLGPIIGGEVLAATYDTLARAPVSVGGYELDARQSGLGNLWSTNLHKKLVIGANSRGARAFRGGGRSVSFNGDGTGAFTPDSDVNDRLVSIAGGYRYIDAAKGTQETYDAQGQLNRVDEAGGGYTLYAYSSSGTPAPIAPAPGYLLSVTDQFNRAVQFHYDSAGRISQIIGTNGSVTSAAYDGSGNLSQLTWPSLAVRKFLYENASLAWALTGITDENNARHATIGYDGQGRAVSTELAGGVNRFSASYSQPPTVVVTDTYDATANLAFRSRAWQGPVAPSITTPTGSALAMAMGTAGNVPGSAGWSQPAGSGCAASSSALTYDANGNNASEDDFNGKRTCQLHDLSRNLESVRVEGLANTQACNAVTATSAVLPVGSRKVSTQWHPDWRLKTKQAEPGRFTTYVYNGQPDPFNGNAPASCAPPAALLPDGKPIAVLCKQVEQATTDPDGSIGFEIPARPGDPSFSGVSLLLHMNGPAESQQFTDSSGAAATLSADGGAKLSTTQSKFGSSSGEFNGGDASLQMPNAPALRLAGGDFTAEAWVRPNSVGSIQAVFAQRDASTGKGWGFYLYSNGTLLFQATSTYALSGTGVVTAGTWQHVAVVRSGSTITMYVNGVPVGSSGSVVVDAETAAPFRVGRDGSVVAYRFGGYIDDARITTGVARYTAAFTPPTAEFGDSVAGSPAIVPIDTAVAARTQSWTYNQHGQVLTHDGPRTDVVDLTTYAYYSNTSFTGVDPNAVGHTIGDLQSVTNAAGKVTQFTNYDKHGQVLESVDPNGVVTTSTYDLRQRLLSTTVGGQTTSYTYDSVGQLTRVTRPDTSYVGFEYDDAHRQKAVFDNLGNRIDYTLDNAGNRTAEQVKDPGGSLRRSLARSIDALGRVQQTTGRE